jgi:hypothetical protein
MWNGNLRMLDPTSVDWIVVDDPLAGGQRVEGRFDQARFTVEFSHDLAEQVDTFDVVRGAPRSARNRGDRQARHAQRADQQADAVAQREHHRIVVHLSAVGLEPDPQRTAGCACAGAAGPNAGRSGR